ncbi:MAG: ectoine hydrolase DoeA [Alphaproteobacteria bacterium]|nr:ectoine hydrolase DoeA [Alphaproteobacteria bacterium]
MPDVALPFDRSEYEARLARVRTAMAARDIDVLLVTDPSNMNWLTGYDGWSFYVHQGVLVFHDTDPLWWGRSQDANGAVRTAWMPTDRIVGYPDHFVQSFEDHPMTHLAQLIRDMGRGRSALGLELDNYYFTGKADRILRELLPNAWLSDATGLVNWCRAVKSPAEIAYMRQAGRIAEEVHARIAEKAEPGLRKNELVAEIYDATLRGADGIGGDYPAIVPLLPSGADAAAPHLTWDDKPMRKGEATFFEIAGCVRRYHCPLSRTIFLGTPPQAMLDAEKAVLEGMEAGLAEFKPGRTCHDVAATFFGVLEKHGIEKDNRTGYSIGVSYPPDWGERTMSLRRDDRSELEPGMTFHFMTGLWMADWGYETTESVLVTERGAECLSSVSRKMLIKT